MGKRAKPEEIIAMLREVEVRLSEGETTGQAARAIGVTEQTYYRWRKEYGGLQVGQAKRMKDMEKENARLRKAISDLTFDNQILQTESEPLPVHPDVKSGTLPNGFSYVILPNKSPPGRFEAHLQVFSGSGKHLRCECAGEQR